jgi:hypothetical protein
MGGGGSKSKKNGKTSKGKTEKNGKATPTNNLAHSKENGAGEPRGEEEMHESWNDPVLFSSNNSHKISKDDFELLHVIGKGSFGKVRYFSIRFLFFLRCFRK